MKKKNQMGFPTFLNTLQSAPRTLQAHGHLNGQNLVEETETAYREAMPMVLQNQYNH